MSRPTHVVDYGGQTPDRREESSAWTLGDTSIRRYASSDRSAVADLQRTRILDAVVEVVAERGIAGSSVSLVTTRASVSRQTFYAWFSGLDDCLVAVLDGALECATQLVTPAFTRGGAWYDGMRSALAAMLAFFDSEPDLTRVCLVEALVAGPVVCEHRERIVQAFRALVVEAIEGEVDHASPLAAEGVLASVIGIVSARLIAGQQAPLISLLGPLMGIIVGPFMDETEVEREIELGEVLTRELLERPAPQAAQLGDSAVGVPRVLLARRAHRVRACLLYVAENPWVSNQEVATGIGVCHGGQVSALLGRLTALGLVSKRAGGPGRPNAWSVTAAGEHVVRELTKRSGRTFTRNEQSE
jgi:AcrR family transcriptional regulator